MDDAVEALAGGVGDPLTEVAEQFGQMTLEYLRHLDPVRPRLDLHCDLGGSPGDCDQSFPPVNERLERLDVIENTLQLHPAVAPGEGLCKQSLLYSKAPLDAPWLAQAPAKYAPSLTLGPTIRRSKQLHDGGQQFGQETAGMAMKRANTLPVAHRCSAQRHARHAVQKPHGMAFSPAAIH